MIKLKVNDIIECFKSRLVAKGYTQTYMIDYTKTFIPIVKINTVQVLLSLTTITISQYEEDFLCITNYLNKSIWISCLTCEGYSHKVCKLMKYFYGFKQSSRSWFKKFIKFMIAFGYH